jgi:hypothetical protein
VANDITVALIGIGSALLGTTVGAIATYYSNKAVKTLEWKHSIKREEIHEKKKLYSSLLAESSRLVLRAIEEKSDQVSEFENITNYIAQIQLISNDAVFNAAVSIADYVVSAHYKNEKERKENFSQLRKSFAKAVREERNEAVNA